MHAGLAAHARYGDQRRLPQAAARSSVCNTSPLTLAKVPGGPAAVAGKLAAFTGGFSPAARDVIGRFGFHTQLAPLDRPNLLHLVVSMFGDLDLAAEVLPYEPDAWLDHSKTRIGSEIPLNRHFHGYLPPRPLAETDAGIQLLEAEIQALLHEVTE